MKLAVLVDRLSEIPEFAGRVSVTANLEGALASVKTTPALVLFAVQENAGPNELFGLGGPRHRVHVVINLLLVLRSAADMRGATALESLQDARAAVFSALLGWVPTGQDFEQWSPLEYAAGRLMYAESGVIAWQDSFSTRYTLNRTI